MQSKSTHHIAMIAKYQRIQQPAGVQRFPSSMNHSFSLSLQGFLAMSRQQPSRGLLGVLANQGEQHNNGPGEHPGAV